MRGDYDDVVTIEPMHNPQNTAAELGYGFVGAEAIGVSRVSLDRIWCIDRSLDPERGDIAFDDRFLRMLG
jgi:hypothetical protein